MLRIESLNSIKPQFQAKNVNSKFAAQKLERALTDNKLSVSTRKSIEKAYETRPVINSIVAPNSQTTEEIGVLISKLAPQEYAVTSAKLAEQKGQKLSLLL